MSLLFLSALNLLSWKQGEVELGNGIPAIRSREQCLEALNLAGFEVSSMHANLKCLIRLGLGKHLSTMFYY